MSGSVGLPARQLSVPIEPIAGESLIGMVARATRLNVLGSTKVILESVGLSLLHPGAVGQEIGDELDSLARQLGCDVAELLSRCHPYLGDPLGPSDIRWGSGALFRPNILVERRRISPASLLMSEHHRADWMNLLLPYCPESLELLVDRCQSCGRTLGWRRAWGIGICDDRKCRAIIKHPTGECLPSSLVSGYRTFAALVSADPETRDRTIGSLNPVLAGLPPAVLVTMLLHIGATMSAEPVNLHRGAIQRLPALTVASIGARGAELVADWPHRFRGAVSEEVDRLRSVRSSNQKPLLEAIRKLGLRPRPEQLLVIREAIPEAFEHSGTALGGLLRPVVNGATVCRRAAIDPAELRVLRETGALRHQLIGSNARVTAQYDLEEVEEFARRKRASEIASRLEQRLGIPRYASEQLASLGEITQEDHRCILAIDGRLRFRSDSIAQFLAAISSLAIAGHAPSDALPLGTAMKRIGGRLKPWGLVLRALREGSMRYWAGPGKRFARSAKVILKDIERFAEVEVDPVRPSSLPITREMTQIDVADVLNLDSLQLRRVVAAGDLSFRPDGVALVASRATVLSLAQETIASAEIALRLGIDFSGVRPVMARHPEVRRCSVGWIRSDFDSTFPTISSALEQRHAAL